MLAAVHGASDEVAEHLAASHPAADPWVTQTLRRAARDALFRSAPAIAAQRLRRALREPPEPAAVPEVLRELADAELLAGEIASAMAHSRQALAHEPDARKRGATALLLVGALVMAGKPMESVAAVDSAIEDLGPLDTALADRLATSAIGAAQLDPDSAEVLAERIGSLRARVQRGETRDSWPVGVVAFALASSGEVPAAAVAELAEPSALLWLNNGARRWDAPGVFGFAPLVQALIRACASRALDTRGMNAVPVAAGRTAPGKRSRSR